MAPLPLQAMDLTSLKAVLWELRPQLLPSRFEKARQADAHTLQLGFRSLEGRTWLELSWLAEAPRLLAIDPPARGGDGSTLAQQLQHGLGGLALVALEQPSWERVVQLQFAPRPGEAISRTLVVELMGRRSNLFLLDQDTPGLERHDYRLIDNHRASDLTLENAVAGEPIAMGRDAQDAIDSGLDHGLIGLCAEAVGIMDLAITTTRDYLKTRQQFGTTLNNFQALQHRMADMLVEMELSRSILYGALSVIELDAMQRAKTISAMKAVVSAAALFVGRNAVQLHGGIGITEECLVSHLYRRLFTISGLFGNEETHLRRMAGG